LSQALRWVGNSMVNFDARGRWCKTRWWQNVNFLLDEMPWPRRRDRANSSAAQILCQRWACTLACLRLSRRICWERLTAGVNVLWLCPRREQCPNAFSAFDLLAWLLPGLCKHRTAGKCYLPHPVWTPTSSESLPQVKKGERGRPQDSDTERHLFTADEYFATVIIQPSIICDFGR